MPTRARSDRVDNPTHRARRVQEVAKRVDRTGRWRVESGEVLWRGRDRKVVRLVHRQPFGRVPRLGEAPSATKPGNGEALGHVLLVMPRVELFPPVVRNVVPDQDG